MMLELGVVVVLLLLFAECLATTSHFETDQITVRVNTFRRNDMLKIFLDHYTKCPIISRIQVVWSDQVNSPPLDWLVGYPNGSVVFEIHRKDSLIARFSPLSPIKTNVRRLHPISKLHHIWNNDYRQCCPSMMIWLFHVKNWRKLIAFGFQTQGRSCGMNKYTLSIYSHVPDHLLDSLPACILMILALENSNTWDGNTLGGTAFIPSCWQKQQFYTRTTWPRSKRRFPRRWRTLSTHTAIARTLPWLP